MLRLTSGAMAELAVQRLLTLQLVLDFATMAARLILDGEILI